MNYLNRALRYITRRKTKSILLIIVFFLIGNLVILGLGVSSAANNAKLLTRKKMKAAISYTVDYQKFYEDAEKIEDGQEREETYKNYPKLDQAVFEEMAKDSRVKTYDYLLETGLNSKKPMYFINTNNNGNSDATQESEIYFRIMGNTLPTMISFEDGTNQIVEGRFYTQADIDSRAMVGVLEKSFADINGIRVGDTLELGRSFGMSQDGEEPTASTDLSVEIIGLYERTVPQSEYYYGGQQMLFMPYSSIYDFQKEMNTKMREFYKLQGEDIGDMADYEPTPYQAFLLLNDPLDVEQFMKDYSTKLAAYTKLDANNAEFNRIARPLDTLGIFANILVWIVTINAVVIISLITALTLKTREYEIGVLLSIGVSKFKVLTQLFVELIVLAMLGFTLSVGSGSLIAGKVGETVLKYQTDAEAQYSDENQGHYFSSEDSYFSQISQEDLFSEYKVTVSAPIIAEIYILGTLVVLIAIVVPSIMIMRLNPKQILLEQN